VRLPGVLPVRGAVADVAAADDQAGALGLGHRHAERAFELLGVVGIGAQHVPAVRLEALLHVLAERQRGVALDRDVVVVVGEDQVAQPEVPRQ
jgi:hypothetical protein